MAPPPQPLIPGIDQVQQRLHDLPTITGTPENVCPAPVDLSQFPGLQLQQASVQADNFDADSHGALVAKVGQINPETIDGARTVWAQEAKRVRDAFETFDAKIGRGIAEKWQGTSGSAAAQAIGNYAQESGQLAEGSSLAARQVGLLTGALSNTKAEMPKEPAETFPGKIAGWLGADGWDDERRDKAKAQAVRLLNNVYYGGGIGPTASGLPVMPQVPPPTGGAPGAAPGTQSSTGSDNGGGTGTGSGGGTSGGGANTGTGSGSSTETGNGATPSNGSGNGHGQAPDGRATDGQAAPTGADPSQLGAASAQNLPGATDPSAASGGLDPSTLGATHAAGFTPPSTGDAGAGLGSGSGFAPGSSSLDSGGSGSNSGAGPGGAVLGSPNLGGSGNGAGTGTSASGARPGAVAGRPGMPGMGAAGAARRGKSGEDAEHKSPDYLHGDHLEEWIHEEAGQKVAPPVLGVRDADGRPKT